MGVTFDYTHVLSIDPFMILLLLTLNKSTFGQQIAKQ